MTKEELENKNKKLESDFRICEKNADTYYDLLTKAKELIKSIIEFDVSYEDEEDFERNCKLYDKIFEETEQFLKELEKKC